MYKSKVIVPTQQSEIAERLAGALTFSTHLQLQLLGLQRHHNLFHGILG